MPPKPLAEDLARKKAERDKQEKTAQAMAALEKPSGRNQLVNALKDPVGTAKQLGRVAKETFYDPSKRFAAAVDPNSGASVADRIAGVGEGILYAADFLTPGVPEGAMARGATRLTDDVISSAGGVAPRPSSVELFELDIPYGKRASAYEQALIRMLDKYGDTSIPSINVNINNVDDLIESQTFDPIVGRRGLVHTNPGEYQNLRNKIEAATGAPVYGYHRLIGDATTAGGYRYGPTSAIINVKPDVVKTMAQGDSLDLFMRALPGSSSMSPQEKLDLFLKKFSPGIPAPRPYMVDEDLRESVMELGLDPQAAAGYGYRELQMQPFRFSPDFVQSVDLLRTSSATGEMLADQRRLAQKMAEQGMDVNTGRQVLLRELLADDIAANPDAYPPELLRQMEFEVFVPDRIPLNRLPSTHSLLRPRQARPMNPLLAAKDEGIA